MTARRQRPATELGAYQAHGHHDIQAGTPCEGSTGLQLNLPASLGEQDGYKPTKVADRKEGRDPLL
jgi:hypothetical protein